MTKATYDAIGDHFRTLWGKEAGWAHSVLFTADLRAFSERLSIKVDMEEKAVKKEDADVETESASKTLALLDTRITIKRELEDEKSLIKVEETKITRKSKRQKRS